MQLGTASDTTSDSSRPSIPSLLRSGQDILQGKTQCAKLYGMSPSSLPRSLVREPSEKRLNKHVIPSLTTAFPHEPSEEYGGAMTPGEWVPFTHPLGFLYFFHPAKRIWTSTYMYSRPHHEQVEQCISLLEDVRHGFATSDALQRLPERYELVVNATTDGRTGGFSWGYYYIDHATLSVFWLDERDLHDEMADMPGSISPDHIYHKIQELYWRHSYLFPHEGRISQFLSPSLLKLHDCIRFYLLDRSMSSDSACLYSKSQLEQMRDDVRSARDRLKAEDPFSPDLVSSLSQIQMCMARQRYRNAHGQPFVRLSATTSIFPPPTTWAVYPGSFTFGVISNIILLGEPFVMLKDLNAVMVDGMMLLAGRKELLERLAVQWGQLLILGTVMLAVNVTFLAIPGVVPDIFGEGGSRDCARYSYISILFGLASIAATLAHVRYTPIDRDETVATTAPYEHLHWFGPEVVATLYSTPFALLLWSMIMFIVAIAKAPFSPVVPPVVYTFLALFSVVLVMHYVTAWFEPRLEVWKEARARACNTVNGMMCKRGTPMSGDGVEMGRFEA
ncbi:unnamed protein product [Peniophora sp. CBMAI 1063]|nr:unnamed protein product [Peniophora sp. CBMAI 1063]